jgi:hypothetical protein
VADLLAAAAHGRFPDADGAVEVFGPDGAGTHAVVELTGHSLLLTDRSPAEVAERGLHGFGGCTHPDALRWLAGASGEIGSLDAVLVRRAATGTALAERTDLDDHPRVARARAHRRDVRVYGDERGLVTLGHALVDRLELSVELIDGAERSAGAGRALITAGLAAAPPGSWVWAQVSPGNAASLRAFLACGFVPIGSEVLIHP